MTFEELKQEAGCVVVHDGTLKGYSHKEVQYEINLQQLLEEGVVVNLSGDDVEQFDVTPFLQEDQAIGGSLITYKFDDPLTEDCRFHAIEWYTDNKECTWAVKADFPIVHKGEETTVSEISGGNVWNFPEERDFMHEAWKQANEDKWYKLSLLVENLKKCPACHGESFFLKRRACNRCKKAGYIRYGNPPMEVVSFDKNEISLAGRAMELFSNILKDQDGTWMEILLELYVKNDVHGKDIIEAAWRAQKDQTAIQSLIWWDEMLPDTKRLAWNLMKEYDIGFFRESFDPDREMHSFLLCIDFDLEDCIFDGHPI